METSNAIETKSENALATMSNPLADDVPTDKVKIPRINILNGTSQPIKDRKQGAQIGNFWNNLTDQNYGDVVHLIPVKLNYGAVYMEQGKGLVCRSHDGITSMEGAKCNECPYGVNYNTWKGKEAPGCAQTVDMLVLEAESMNPAIVTLSKSSYNEGKKISTTIKMSKVPLMITLGYAMKPSKKGDYASPVMKASRPLTQEQFDTMMRWRTQLSQNRERYVASDDVADSVETGDDGLDF